MQEPSTPNPSDSDNSPKTGDQEEAPKRHLKLKPLRKIEPEAPRDKAIVSDKQRTKRSGDARPKPLKLKVGQKPDESDIQPPVNPPIESTVDDQKHASAPPRDQPSGKLKPLIPSGPKNTPSSKNQDSASAKTESDKESKPSKLKDLAFKRIIVKDVEINPHINPDAEPVPRAEVYAEEEPEPLLPANSAQPPVSPPIPRKGERTDQPKGRTPRPASSDEAENEKKPVPLFRKLLAFMVFGIVLICAFILAFTFFNPFGQELARIEPAVEIPVEPVIEQSRASKVDFLTTSAGEATFDKASPPDLSEFLKTLESQKLIASENPDGVFIDRVFVPDGAIVNADRDLTFQSVSMVEGRQVLIFSTPELPTVIVPFPLQ